MAEAASSASLRPHSLVCDFLEGAERQGTSQLMDSQPSSTMALPASQLRPTQPHLPLAPGPALLAAPA